MKKRGNVAIYGGGIAGGVLAKALAHKASVTLVDPLDYFEVPMGAPRNLVKPDFAEQAILPFAAALPSVLHVRARLVRLETGFGIVENSEGERTEISADVAVLATGSRFPNNLMRTAEGTHVQRKAFYARIQKRLSDANRILIVGGGPIGVEVAGEIIECWPDKSVTILEIADRLLGGTSEEVASFATSYLRSRGVRIFAGDRMHEGPDASANLFAPGGEVKTVQGRTIAYDIILWCTGGRPDTGYMSARFAQALNPEGRIRVGPDLRVVGCESLFAMGDVTDLRENKMAFHILGQLSVVKANVLALLKSTPGKLLKTYKAKTNNPTMVVSLGSRAGISQLPSPIGVVRSAWFNRMAKAETMLVPRYRKTICE
jgi:NADH dehydrogenase FAD-containing subunit